MENAWTTSLSQSCLAMGGPERQRPLSFWGQGGAHARVVGIHKLDPKASAKAQTKTPCAAGLGAAHLLPSLWSRRGRGSGAFE